MVGGEQFRFDSSPPQLLYEIDYDWMTGPKEGSASHCLRFSGIAQTHMPDVTTLSVRLWGLMS
jgi:hypothetical protein